VLLAEIAGASRDVAATRARLAKVERLAACLRALAPDEVPIAVAWLAGELPQGRVGAGWAALRDTAGMTPAEHATLTVGEVDAALGALVGVRGAGAGAERARRIGALFARATAEEQGFLRRLLLGELRQGALEGVMVEAVARAAGVGADAVRGALTLTGSLPVVARVALAEGAAGLAAFRIEPGRALAPMLAQSAADPAEALARLGRAAFEWKLDGARVQLHRAGDDVRVFTRTGNDVAAAVPELVAAARALPLRQVVLDGEALALAPDGAPLPFQVTMRRFGRRLDVERLRAELPLSPFFFDCLHLDGEDLIARPAGERWRALAERVPAAQRLARLETDDLAAAGAFVAEALARGHEGAMAKALDAPYAAGQRGAAWLKLKTAHTLDLVVLAVEWGSGRREGLLSNLHLGARDPDRGGFVMLGKTFKGLTDALLAWQTRELLAREIGRSGNVVHVRPELVVEIAFDGVQASPRYPAGLALRFARVKRYRPDKGAGEADTIEHVRAIARRQGTLGPESDPFPGSQPSRKLPGS
jgi:DNA ligase-1